MCDSSDFGSGDEPPHTMLDGILSGFGSADEAEETALVTGASSGIGYELTKLLASEGHDVVLVSRSESKLERIGETLEADHGIETTVVAADLAERSGAKSVYERVTERGLAVDLLVNNAGFGVYGRFDETDLEEELDMVRLHVETTTVLTKLFGRDMADRGHGYVLNNASVAGFIPVPTSAVYTAAKHYQRSFSEALAEELGPAGVTVTALCPGETDTAFMEQGNFEAAAYEDDDLMDPRTVAEAGYEGLMRGERVVVPGIENKLKVFSRRLTPRRLFVKTAKRVQAGE